MFYFKQIYKFVFYCNNLFFITFLDSKQSILVLQTYEKKNYIKCINKYLNICFLDSKQSILVLQTYEKKNYIKCINKYLNIWAYKTKIIYIFCVYFTFIFYNSTDFCNKYYQLVVDTKLLFTAFASN